MRNLRQVTLLAGAGLLLAAPLAFAQVDAAQFKCQQAVSKAGPKFVGSKSKCITKCLQNAWKGIGSFSDCNPPSYGGTTATCIQDSLKGAEGKFSLAIRKTCDPTLKVGSKAECPTCYDSGDCSLSGFATDQVANIEGQVDSFVPGVACEQAGADVAEQKCETATSKALVKQVAGVEKCYDTCNANLRKALIPPGSCNPPSPSDAATSTCISGVDAKAIAAANKGCGGECISGTCSPSKLPCSTNADCGDQSVKPDCSSPDDYPTGSSWVNLVDTAISGNIPGIYCQ